ncbi:hypothetical protein K503DRAFT_814906 [Rhizopogon vinicolor AM-OR11-026]|uniref:Uncharacterized protein n=1 Tax=Rhizopogon vinicolor AM-OR11-026 TaxID=1314800 RepID=A0A1B7MEW2_9AGAM|nr:hypothetical protein K503DRAFT_814906 [Rhizopogon vinicolor AM-OR11-026]
MSGLGDMALYNCNPMAYQHLKRVNTPTSGFRKTTTTMPLAFLANAVESEIAESPMTPKSHKKWEGHACSSALQTLRKTTAKSSPSSAPSTRAYRRHMLTRPLSISGPTPKPHHGALAFIRHLRAQAAAYERGS